MSDGVTIKVRGPNPAKFDAYADRVERALMSHLYKEGEGVIAVSKETFVPVDTGTLRSTGFVEQPRKDSNGVSVRLGFGGPSAPYAFIVHEDPDAHHPVGSWKYLEIPFRQNIKNLESRIKSAIAAVRK